MTTVHLFLQQQRKVRQKDKTNNGQREHNNKEHNQRVQYKIMYESSWRFVDGIRGL